MIPSKIVLRPLGAVLAASIVLWSGIAPAAEDTKLLALVIGNSNYESGHLNGPENDALDMAKVFRRIGFTISNKSIVNLGRDSMQREIQVFLDSVDEKTVAVIYYSGHGMEDDRKNYLVPTDAKIKTYDDVDNNLVPLDGMLRRLDQREARARIVILDACRNMPASLLYRKKEIENAGGLAEISNMTGTKIIYAAAPRRVAIAAADGERNSVFTAAILQAINEKYATFNDIVVRAAQLTYSRTNKRQSPWITGDVLSTFPIYAELQSNPLNVAPTLAHAAINEEKSGNIKCDEVSEQIIENGYVTWRKVCKQ